MIFTDILRHWKRCIILSSILVFCFTSTGVHACYETPDREELRYMLFNPDLVGNKSWWSFFYSTHLHAFNGGYTTTTDEDMLTAEWIAAVGGRANTAAARACLFGSLSDSALKTNTFYRKLQQRPALARYFELARRCEPLSVFSWTLWENDQEEVLACEYENVAATIEAALQTERDPFLQKKYAFQLVKLACYWHDSKRCRAVYTRYFKEAEHRSVLDWWAAHYMSMNFEQKGETDSANYLHGLVFAHSSAKMMVSQQMYSSKNFDRVLLLAKNDVECADTYVMRESINPGRSLEGIQKVYELAPDHTSLPFLIGREVNKLEDWLGTTKYINVSVGARDYWSERPVMENWAGDRAYLDQFTAAVERMDILAKTYPAYYHLALATLNLMQENTRAAAAHLKQVDNRDPDVAYQATVLRIILITQQEDLRKPLVQDKLGKLYQTLLAKRKGRFESMKILYSLSAYLRYTFANKELTGFAGLFDNYATDKFCNTCITYGTSEYTMIRYLDQHASIEDIEQVVRQYNKKDKNALEAVLFKPFTHPYYFYDLLATKYLRAGKVKKALATLRQVPDSFWLTFSNALENLTDDPFTNTRDLLGTQTMASYTKREIIERLDALEEEAATNAAARARNYFLLANAWYNFTQSSWFMLSYGAGSATPDRSVYAIGYKKAFRYYEQSLAHENNPEQRAKVLYMLALLTERRYDKLPYARAYEQYKNTGFYSRRNCLTTRDLVEKGW